MILRVFSNRLFSRGLHLATNYRRALKTSIDNEFLIVEESDRKLMKFPAVWLRDNCQCEICFHPDSQSRKICWEHFDVNVKIENVSIENNKNEINVVWSDKHNSSFDVNWLKEREFSEGVRKKYLSKFYRPEYNFWGKNDFKTVCQNFEFNDIMQSNDVLRRWLEALAIYGIAMIKNAPLQKDTVRKIIGRVGFIRKTSYGEEFIVEAKPGTKNYAYLSTPLQIHIDLPYYEYSPGINILHCIVQTASSGGSNLLSDGFFAADKLKKEYPEYFETLTETLVDWNDIGQEEEGKPFHKIFRSPVICLDQERKFTRINYSVPQRDSHFSVPLENVIQWYKALAKYVEILHKEAVKFKVVPGDIITFNNIRTLHGREGYDDSEGNTRYIVGAYIDWDAVYSKLRVLKKITSSSV